MYSLAVEAPWTVISSVTSIGICVRAEPSTNQRGGFSRSISTVS
jgi:hypothetical protein